MREGAPTQLSLEEKRYWVQNHPDFKDIPERILRLVPKIGTSKSEEEDTLSSKARSYRALKAFV
jgi:hypothetical protein